MQLAFHPLIQVYGGPRRFWRQGVVGQKMTWLKSVEAP